MNLFEIMRLLSSKDGDELFEKAKEILSRVGIDVYNDDYSVKDLYQVACELVEVMNKGK